jgi:hypothetical protein
VKNFVINLPSSGPKLFFLKGRELERCMPLPMGDAAEEGKVWSALVHGADSLGSSTWVIVALAAAAKAKIQEFEVPSSVSDLLGALTHIIAHSLSLSAHLTASLRLQAYRLRLKHCETLMDLKEDLLRMPLFPSSLKSLIEGEKEKTVFWFLVFLVFLASGARRFEVLALSRQVSFRRPSTGLEALLSPVPEFVPKSKRGVSANRPFVIKALQVLEITRVYVRFELCRSFCPGLSASIAAPRVCFPPLRIPPVPSRLMA